MQDRAARFFALLPASLLGRPMPATTGDPAAATGSAAGTRRLD